MADSTDPSDAVPVSAAPVTAAGRIVCSPAGAWFAWGMLAGLAACAVGVWIIRKKL